MARYLRPADWPEWVPERPARRLAWSTVWAPSTRAPDVATRLQHEGMARFLPHDGVLRGRPRSRRVSHVFVPGWALPWFVDGGHPLYIASPKPGEEAAVLRQLWDVGPTRRADLAQVLAAIGPAGFLATLAAMHGRLARGEAHPAPERVLWAVRQPR